jgi:DNA-3-methyladenine glycosylase II
MGVGTVNFTLYPNGLFDFPAMLRRVAEKNSLLCSVSADRTVYRRVLRVGHHPVPICVTFLGTVDKPELLVELPSSCDATTTEEVIQQVSHMFEVSLNLDAIAAHFETMPEMAMLFAMHRGLRRVLDADPFESLVRTIIGQQLNVSFAATLTDRLVAYAGEPISGTEGLFAFPTAGHLVGHSVEAFMAMSFSRRKAEYILGIAQVVHEGKLDLRNVGRAPEEDVFSALLPLRGIGKWSVECLLLFAYGRMDMIPAGDIGVRNAIRNLYHLTTQPEETMVRDMAEAWAPYRSYATYYLWQSLMN